MYNVYYNEYLSYLIYDYKMRNEREEKKLCGKSGDVDHCGTAEDMVEKFRSLLSEKWRFSGR